MSAEQNQFIQAFLASLEQQAKHNISRMPPLDNLPHMEPHLRQLYLETYYVTLVGLHNVSIVMQGVLLEALVKEVIFENERRDFQEPFGPAIRRCEKNGYLTGDEIKFLDDFKDGIRNLYQHVDIKKLTENMYVGAWKIKIDSKDPGGSIIKALEEIRKGIRGLPELITYDDLRPVGAIIKEGIDKRRSLPLFIKVDDFVRTLCKKYFPVS